MVLDNSGWAAVKGATLRVYPNGQAKTKGSFPSLAADMDFSKTVEAAGGYGERLVDPTEVPAAISRCLAQVRKGRSALLRACVTKL